MAMTKLPTMYENIDTPPNMTNAVKTLSESLLGTKSPNPTVVSDVNEKYERTIILSATVSSS